MNKCETCAQRIQQISHAAKQVITGEARKVSEDVQAARLQTCQSCSDIVRWHKGLPETAEVGLMDRCGACGCFLRAKAKFDFDCPKGKWT